MKKWNLAETTVSPNTCPASQTKLPPSKLTFFHFVVRESEDLWTRNTVGALNPLRGLRKIPPNRRLGAGSFRWQRLRPRGPSNKSKQWGAGRCQAPFALAVGVGPPTRHRPVTDLSRTRHGPVTDLSRTRHRPVTDPSPTCHRPVTDPSPTRHRPQLSTTR